MKTNSGVERQMINLQPLTDLWTPLRRSGKSDLSELKGKRVQLRMRAERATIFGDRLTECQA